MVKIFFAISQAFIKMVLSIILKAMMITKTKVKVHFSSHMQVPL